MRSDVSAHGSMALLLLTVALVLVDFAVFDLPEPSFLEDDSALRLEKNATEVLATTNNALMNAARLAASATVPFVARRKCGSAEESPLRASNSCVSAEYAFDSPLA